MKRDLIDKFSSFTSITGLVIALLSVTLDAQFANDSNSLMLSFMIAASAIAAIGAYTKIFSGRRRPKTGKGRIFLIYAKEDTERIEKIYDELKRSGLKPWLDTHDILPGQDWKQTITEALKESDLALACLSKASVSKKGFVQSELKIALDILEERSRGVSPVIPVRLEETEVPERLKNLQWIDLFENGNIMKLKTAIEKASAMG